MIYREIKLGQGTYKKYLLNETGYSYWLADDLFINANECIYYEADIIEEWWERLPISIVSNKSDLPAYVIAVINAYTPTPSGSMKYHLYAWDYASGAAIAYSEKEVPQAGDVVFLKEDMEGGKITDPAQLKLIYHVVSDADGKITVSEHPEGSTGGYVFNRNEADDYEEEITDVRDMVDITTNGLLMSQKGTVLKGVNSQAATPFSASVIVSEDGDDVVFGWNTLSGKVDAMDAYNAIDDNHNWAVLDETSKSIIKVEVISNDIDGIAQSSIAGHELVACFFVADNATYANISRKYSVTVENPY